MLGTDTNKLIFNNFPLNLLQLYFLFGFLSNYHYWVNVSSGILILIIIITIFSSNDKLSAGSPLIILYSFLVFLSLLNHTIVYYDTGYLPKGARTMPIVLLAMIVCRKLTISGLFRRLVSINVLPIIIILSLVILEGYTYHFGRFESSYLSPNLIGIMVPFGFALGLDSILSKSYNLRSIFALIGSVIFIILAGQRQLNLYMICVFLMLLIWNKNYVKVNYFRYVIIISFAITLVLPVFISQQEERTSKLSLYEQIYSLLRWEPIDRSSAQRMGFIELAIKAANDNWIGYGNANFKWIVSTYNYWNLSLAGHPHSSLAEVLITGGYPGLAIFLIMIIYLWRIGYKDNLMRMCLLWLVFQIVFATSLNDRILWPLIAIAERESQINL